MNDTQPHRVGRLNIGSPYGATQRLREGRTAPQPLTVAAEAGATFRVVSGVNQLTVFGAEPGDELALVDADGLARVTLVADAFGQVNFAYLPADGGRYDTGHGIAMTALDGDNLGTQVFSVVDLSTSPPQVVSGVRALGLDDLPDPALYDQELVAGLNYVEMRDGVRLAAAVHLPPDGLYGPGPYPTVMEYSGYSPADPKGGAQTALLLPLMGFAVVGVNMRGSGASGGVYDVFSPANQADGYDMIETIARQSWAAGGRVGMVGLSYPGIAQLITAATRPPSLAAIAPMSVIDDPWRQQWPGGVYNSGFTREWLEARDSQSIEGQGWELALADAGDEICSENLRLRGQDIDFEDFVKSLEFYPSVADIRRIRLMLPRIDVPVFLTGSWQDEQTGSRFATMLEQFQAAPVVRATMFNGHHPDGFHPANLLRVFEFLSFYVAGKVPRMHPLVRAMAPGELEKVFFAPVELEADRFDHFDDEHFADALAAYESEAPVRVIIDSGANGTIPGAFGGTAELEWASFPPPNATIQRWFFGADGTLADTVGEAGTAGFHVDPDAGEVRTFAPHLADPDYPTVTRDAFIPPVVPHDWQHFDARHEAIFVAAPAAEPLLVAGPGHVDLWVCAGSSDPTIAVTVSVLADHDGDPVEVRVQDGLLRLGHSVEMADESTELWPEYTYAESDFAPIAVGEWVRRRVPIPPVVYPLRVGERLKVSLHSPGRTAALWAFALPPVETESVRHDIGCGGDHASSLVLAVVHGETADRGPSPMHRRGHVTRPVPAQF